MKRRHALAIALLALAALAGGCASTYEAPFNPAWFARTPAAAESRAPGQVALLLRPPVQGLVQGVDKTPAGGMRLPIGQIVEQALQMAAIDTLRGGAVRVPQQPAVDAGFDATLVVEAVRVEHGSEAAGVTVVPIPPFVAPGWQFHARLAFDLALLDAQGRTVWTRSYDSGREVWKRPSFWSNEPLQVGFGRMAHEAAWRLAQQAVADLRDWLQAERNKPREL